MFDSQYILKYLNSSFVVKFPGKDAYVYDVRNNEGNNEDYHRMEFERMLTAIFGSAKLDDGKIILEVFGEWFEEGRDLLINQVKNHLVGMKVFTSGSQDVVAEIANIFLPPFFSKGMIGELINQRYIDLYLKNKVDEMMVGLKVQLGPNKWIAKRNGVFMGFGSDSGVFLKLFPPLIEYHRTYVNDQYHKWFNEAVIDASEALIFNRKIIE